MKNWLKTVSIREKLDIINQHEKGEFIFAICHNVRFAHSNLCTVCDNANSITESAKSGTKVFM
jgi:hypothetical protein